MQNDEFVSQFLVYPHKQIDTNTGEEVFHNRCRTLVFPDRAIVSQAMSMSNPHVNSAQVTPESGQNQQVKNSDGSTTLEIKDGIDWFAFQESLKQLGCMGIVDLEGPQAGSRVFNSEKRINAGKFIGVFAIGTILWGMTKLRKGQPLFAEDVEVVDDLYSYYH